MKTIAFDIETIADKSVLPFLPEIEPDSRLVNPVKIQANIEKKKAEQTKTLESFGVDVYDK